MNKFNNPNYSLANTIHEFTVEKLNGELIKLDIYKDFVCIFANTATKSPFTTQNYKHFNELMDKHGDRLRILAFPCNQFNLEEPGTNEEIAEHAEKNNVKFDIFAKVDVNGEEACVVWKFLKHHLPGNAKSGAMVKANYTKFIVDKDGLPVERYGPEVDPVSLEKHLSRYINDEVTVALDD